MTRKGKIARLPHHVRENLNRRLQDGEVGTALVEWLNSLPEVQAVMASEFGGQPVNEPNLTQWKGGGYEDWLAKQESLSEVGLLVEEADEFEKLDAEDLMDRLSLWLTVRCAVEAREQRATGADPDLGAFGRLCRGLSSLRRGEQSARRLEIEEERLELEKKRLDVSLGVGSQTLDKLFWEWTERPDIKEKLFPKPLSPEEQSQEYKRILGLDPDKELPGERYRREQFEKRADEFELRLAALEEQEAEFERRKAELERKKAAEEEKSEGRGSKSEGNPDPEKIEDPTWPQCYGAAGEDEAQGREEFEDENEDEDELEPRSLSGRAESASREEGEEQKEDSRKKAKTENEPQRIESPEPMIQGRGGCGDLPSPQGFGAAGEQEKEEDS